MIDYNEACNRAATDQGLDPIMAALDAAGIEHELYQSGGFCMILIVETGATQLWLTNAEAQWGGPPGYAYFSAGHICHSGRDEDYDNCPACYADGDAVPFGELAERIRVLREEV